MIEELYEANAARPSDSLYYFRTHMKIHGGLVQDTKIEAIDWPSFLRDHDGIVLIGTDIGFEFYWWGFYETLDRALDRASLLQCVKYIAASQAATASFTPSVCVPVQSSTTPCCSASAVPFS